MVTKSSKITLRKADKPRTALKALKKEAQWLENRQRKMAANPKELHVIENAVINRKLSNNKKKQEAVQKVIKGGTKANNKDLSKSLWNVSSNKWMKKADGNGMYKNAVIALWNAKNVAAEKAWNFYRSSWVWADAYYGMKRADKDVKRLEKEVASLKKYNKWKRFPQRKK